MNPYLIDQQEADRLGRLDTVLYYSTEWDEFWSFVGSKAHQRWTWYLLERRTGLIVAWQNGRRQDAVLQALLDKVAHLSIGICYSDDWGGYERVVSGQYLHRVGKEHTWRIERRNLNFRTHLKRLSRRTLCFSKDEGIHDRVVSMYIECYYYRHGQFSDAA